MEEQQHDNVRRHDSVGTIFLRLGYDINDNADVQRLAANLRYAEQHRQAEERNDTNRLAWVVTGIIAVLGSALTVVGQIVFNKLFGVMK